MERTPLVYTHVLPSPRELATAGLEGLSSIWPGRRFAAGFGPLRSHDAFSGLEMMVKVLLFAAGFSVAFGAVLMILAATGG